VKARKTNIRLSNNAKNQKYPNPNYRISRKIHTALILEHKNKINHKIIYGKNIKLSLKCTETPKQPNILPQIQ
jgi:hypothetical protein